MLVKVAGYNIDTDLLGRLKDALWELSQLSEEGEFDVPEDLRDFWNADNLTPETISAAYARISRYPEAVGELRRIAIRSVSRARKSNRTIVFDYGHSSIAEHAVFNIDVVGISRLAVESVEARRLMSYTEKSQRYIAVSKDYIVPAEFKHSPFERRFNELCQNSFETYFEFLKVIEESISTEGDETLKYSAQEDARYILPLACSAQLGMTGNARNLGHLLRRTLRHPLAELREFASRLRDEVMQIAPSLFRHLEDEQFEPEISSARYSGEIPAVEVELIKYNEDADEMILASMVSCAEGLGYGQALERVKKLSDEERKAYFRNKLEGLKSFHSLPRVFEAVDFGFQISLSSSAFAQLKRHRMALLLPQPYEPQLGYTIPQSIEDTGLKERFVDIMGKSGELYERIVERFPHQAPYVLTNAHRRVVYFQANARELYHFARLRMDKSAQWDIRHIATKIIELAREKSPLTMAFACGKEEFDRYFKEVNN